MSNAVDRPGLAVRGQVAEALVRLLRRAEARELAHRPQPAAVHRRVDAARERELAGPAEVALVVDVDVVGRVERLVLDAGDRGEELALPLRRRLVPTRATRPRRRSASPDRSSPSPASLGGNRFRRLVMAGGSGCNGQPKQLWISCRWLRRRACNRPRCRHTPRSRAPSPSQSRSRTSGHAHCSSRRRAVRSLPVGAVGADQRHRCCRSRSRTTFCEKAAPETFP